MGLCNTSGVAKVSISFSHLQVVNGYFVHFFAPQGLPVVPKNVVFVIDVSGSMSGRKIEQVVPESLG
jgi:secreted protein with Ig-like and vWFA domain